MISSLLPSFKLWSGNFNNMDLSPDGSRIITSALDVGEFRDVDARRTPLTAINSR